MAGLDVVTLGAAKKYVNDSLVGVGAIKGSPCEIQSITPITGGKRITYAWIDTENVTHTDTLDVMDGEDGADGESVQSAAVNENGELLLTLTDGEIINCGVITGEAKLKQALTATTEIGSVTKGKNYPVGTDLEAILRDILISYAPPVVALTTTPNTRLYDIVTESVATIMLRAAVTKKTNDVTKITFYVGDTVVNEVTSGVADGGNFSYQYTPSTAIRTDTTFKATVTDGKQATSSTFAIKFVGKSYYGICDADVSDPSATVIKSGNSTLKDVKNLVYSGITTGWGKIFYAYPKSFGALTYIKDEINNINYFDSFQQSEVTVDGIPYYCYTLIEPTAAENNQVTFK